MPRKNTNQREPAKLDKESRRKESRKTKAGPSLTGPSLRELAARRGILIGTCVAPKLSEPEYAAVLAREYDFVTSENHMKWGCLSKAPGVYDFAEADRMVDFARKRRQAVHGHTLLWHNSLPPYLKDYAGSRAELIDMVRAHINTVAGRYRGRILVWDVVNEVFSDKNPEFRPSVFSTVIGREFVPMAYRFAREADPGAKLLYNDYCLEGQIAVKSDFCYQTVREWLAEGVPLDGIGFQCHLDNLSDIGLAAEQMARYADLGLDIYVTELDFRLPLPADKAMFALQGRLYHDLMRVCLAFPTFRGFQTWGFTDKYSWVPGFFNGLGDALPFDADYRPKPAYHALRAALEECGGRRARTAVSLV
jgi:endo-1,4-beta-xylanase